MCASGVTANASRSWYALEGVDQRPVDWYSLTSLYVRQPRAPSGSAAQQAAAHLECPLKSAVDRPQLTVRSSEAVTKRPASGSTARLDLVFYACALAGCRRATLDPFIVQLTTMLPSNAPGRLSATCRRRIAASRVTAITDHLHVDCRAPMWWAAWGGPRCAAPRRQVGEQLQPRCGVRGRSFTRCRRGCCGGARVAPMLRVNCAVLAVLAWIAYEHLPPSLPPPVPPLDTAAASATLALTPRPPTAAHPDLPLSSIARRSKIRLRAARLGAVADAATATWAAQFRWRARRARLRRRPLVNRLSGGCISRGEHRRARPRQHEPVAARAAERVDRAAPRGGAPSRCEGCAAGGGVRARRRRAVCVQRQRDAAPRRRRPPRRVGARECARTTAATLKSSPSAATAGLRFRGAASGGLVRLVHAEMPESPS